MDRSSLIVVLIPITTLVALFTGMALPFIAGGRSGRGHAWGRLGRAAARTRIGAAGRKARPPEPGAEDAAPAGYLYVPCVRDPRSGHPAGTRRWVQEVPIVKTTARLIYYTSDSWDRTEAVVSPGCINREEFETDTRCHQTCPRDIAAGPVCAAHGRGRRHCVHVLAPGRHCRTPGGCGQDCPADTRGARCARHGYTWEHCPHGEDRCRHGYPAGVIPVPGHRHRSGPAGQLFFATRQAAEDHLHRGERQRAERPAPQAPSIKELRRAMADAHPDRGGTAEQFIQARRRYQTALRSARQHQGVC
jgi:hypothetical protein